MSEAKAKGTRLTKYESNTVDLAVSGTLPAFLGTLTALTSLILGNLDKVSGTLPASLGRLTALTRLVIFSTKVSGTLPELGALKDLCELYFSDPLPLGVATFDSPFSGTIPAALGLLTKLAGFGIGSKFLQPGDEVF